MPNTNPTTTGSSCRPAANEPAQRARLYSSLAGFEARLQRCRREAENFLGEHWQEARHRGELALPIGPKPSGQRTRPERIAVVPALLDSSFLIDLEREIQSGVAGPALAWLRKNRTLAQRPLLASCIAVAEFLEGCGDANEGMKFICRFIPQSIGFQHGTKCAELQRRARKVGRRFGENDAWKMAFAERAHASVVGRDRRAFLHLGVRYEQFDRPVTDS